MEADVPATRLPASGQGELVRVGWEMARAIHRRSGPMGHHAILGSALPGRHGGAQLQPGRAELEVVGFPGAAHPVHAVRHSLEGAATDLA